MNEEVKKLVHLVLLEYDEETRKQAFKVAKEILGIKYGHYCLEFDGLYVDETLPEWEHCLCRFQNKENKE